MRWNKNGKLPEGAIFCTMDVAGFYPNVPHGEFLVSLRKFFGTRDNKQWYLGRTNIQTETWKHYLLLIMRKVC